MSYVHEILGTMSTGTPTAGEIAMLTKVNPDTVSLVLGRLVTRGKVEEVAVQPEGVRRYRLSARERSARSRRRRAAGTVAT